MNCWPAAVAVCILLTGCDIFYSVRRASSVDGVPTPQCLFDAAQAATGVEQVTWLTDYPGRPYYGVAYRGPNVSGTLTFAPSVGQLSQTFIRANSKPKQAEMDATRRVMREIEQRVDRDCGLIGAEGPREECMHVWCKR
jgi:hypothetical protein